MKDENRIKSELIRELKSLRKQVKRRTFAERKRKQTEDALATERNLLHTLIDSLPDRIYVKDTESRFLLNNLAHIRYLGAESQEEVTGKTDFDFRPSELATRYWSDDQHVIQSGEALINREEPTVFSSNKTGWHLATKVPLRDPQGKIVGLVGISRDITAHKQAEEALFESETKYRTLVTHSPDGIFVLDLSGTFLSVNQIMCDILKYTEEELLSMKLGDIVPQQYMFLFNDRLAALKKGEKINTSAEYEVIGKDGVVHCIEVRSIPYYKDKEIIGFQSIARDITEHKKAQEALRESEDQILLLLNSTAEAIYGIDLDGNCTFCNNACVQMLGYKNTNELLGKNMHWQIHSKYANGIPFPIEECRIFQAFRKGEKSHVEDDVLWKADGTSFPAEYWSHPERRDGKIVGAVVTFLDITERKKTEEALKRAKQIAEEATRAKSAFLATMSHEIRTPMNGVIGMTDLLLQTPLTPEQKDFVSTLQVSGESLLTIIDDILDFSKIESGKLELEKNPFELKMCIEDVLTLFSTKVSQKKLDLLYWIDPQVPQFIVGDIQRIRQILVNLVGNAIKFTEQGEVYVSAKLLWSLGDQLELNFTVKDTGMGIPADKIDMLFKAFSQVDSSTTRRFGGTGLGLAISKSLTELMGGTIRVESEWGKGSTFLFTIKSSVPPADFILPKIHLKGKAPELSGRRVLIVDDNATNL
ncbi:MAG: PAS domain S-box protein [Bacteroidota bacterium]